MDYISRLDWFVIKLVQLPKISEYENSLPKISGYQRKNGNTTTSSSQGWSHAVLATASLSCMKLLFPCLSSLVRWVTQILLSSTYSDTQPVAPASEHSDNWSATGLYGNAMISSESLCIFQFMSGLYITEILLISRGINALSFWPGRGTWSLSFFLPCTMKPSDPSKITNKKAKM